MNTLCGKQVLGHKESDDPTVAHIEEGVKIQPVTVGTCVLAMDAIALQHHYGWLTKACYV